MDDAFVELAPKRAGTDRHGLRFTLPHLLFNSKQPGLCLLHPGLLFKAEDLHSMQRRVYIVHERDCVHDLQGRLFPADRVLPGVLRGVCDLHCPRAERLYVLPGPLRDELEPVLTVHAALLQLHHLGDNLQQLRLGLLPHGHQLRSMPRLLPHLLGDGGRQLPDLRAGILPGRLDLLPLQHQLRGLLLGHRVHGVPDRLRPGRLDLPRLHRQLPQLQLHAQQLHLLLEWPIPAPLRQRRRLRPLRPVVRDLPEHGVLHHVHLLRPGALVRRVLVRVSQPANARRLGLELHPLSEWLPELPLA